MQSAHRAALARVVEDELAAGLADGVALALRRAGDAGGFAAMEAHLRRVAALVPGAWVGPAGDA